MLIKVTTIDADDVWVNPTYVVLTKYHPSTKKPTQGYVLLTMGKELFLTLESFRHLMDTCNGNHAQAQQ